MFWKRKIGERELLNLLESLYIASALQIIKRRGDLENYLSSPESFAEYIHRKYVNILVGLYLYCKRDIKKLGDLLKDLGKPREDLLRNPERADNINYFKKLISLYSNAKSSLERYNLINKWYDVEKIYNEILKSVGLDPGKFSQKVSETSMKVYGDLKNLLMAY